MDRAVSSEFVVADSTSVTVQLVGTVGSPMLTTLVVTTEPTRVATEAGAGTELGPSNIKHMIRTASSCAS